MLQIAKCTTWDGREFYTDTIDTKSLNNFWNNIKQQCSEAQLSKLKIDQVPGQVEIIEMTQEEYFAIPTTNEAADLFA